MVYLRVRGRARRGCDAMVERYSPIITIGTTTVMSNDIKASTLECLPLSRSLEFSHRTFHSDYGINLSHCVVIAECCGELWLRSLSRDLFSP